MRSNRLLTCLSLPHDALRDPMRRSEAVQGPPIDIQDIRPRSDGPIMRNFAVIEELYWEDWWLDELATATQHRSETNTFSRSDGPFTNCVGSMESQDRDSKGPVVFRRASVTIPPMPPPSKSFEPLSVFYLWKGSTSDALRSMRSGFLSAGAATTNPNIYSTLQI